MVCFLDLVTETPTELDLDLKLLSGVSLKNLVSTNDSLYSLLAKNISVELNLKSNKDVSQAVKKMSRIAKVERA
jgi:hypothetical protein